MQIKTTVRYYTPSRTAKITKCLKECEATQTLIHYTWEHTLENSLATSYTLIKINIHYSVTQQFLFYIFTQRKESICPHKDVIQMLIATSFIIAQNVNNLNIPQLMQG